MMQKLRDPKNVKMISLFVAAIFVLGCFALTLTQSGVNSVASAASSESAIGVVNYQMLLSQVPDLQNVQTSMKQEIDNAQKDFDEKSKTINFIMLDAYSNVYPPHFIDVLFHKCKHRYLDFWKIHLKYLQYLSLFENKNLFHYIDVLQLFGLFHLLLTELYDLQN